MELLQLVEQLSGPSAYPSLVESIEVVQTHISVVFLAGSFVYKIKKPLHLEFLDFSTLEKRKHFCDEEVRLNRRLAPDVYLGVVRIVDTPEGLRFEAEGDAVEWAVKMQRLPQEATLQQRLYRNEVSPELLETIAGKLASFHASASRSEHIASFGRFDLVANNVRDNLVQAATQIGKTISQPVFERLGALFEQALGDCHALIADRASQSVPCDTHGDLRLDHIYLFPDRAPPGDLVIIDCIEFSERFRYADPVADVAFLAMDLAFHGRRDLARQFSDAYFRASGDEAGRRLLSFYVSYRSAVRAKVHGLTAQESELSESQRARSLTRARAHWLLALVELEVPQRRPALILIAGLPGVGKSTLARNLAERAGFQRIRSDVVRRELSGTGDRLDNPRVESGKYSPEWTERTYAECLHQAEAYLFQGKRVIVDANFRLESQRQQFLESATRWGVPSALLLCEASEITIRARLQTRTGDASEADWPVYQWTAQQWQEPGELTSRHLCRIATDGGLDLAAQQALECIRGLGLA
jgi:aminoglycoside phosphotransferase family enzyme/predicted kinase